MDQLQSFPIDNTVRRYVLKRREEYYLRWRDGEPKFCSNYLDAYLFYTKNEAKDYAKDIGLYRQGFRPRCVLIPNHEEDGDGGEIIFAPPVRRPRRPEAVPVSLPTWDELPAHSGSPFPLRPEPSLWDEILDEFNAEQYVTNLLRPSVLSDHPQAPSGQDGTDTGNMAEPHQDL